MVNFLAQSSDYLNYGIKAISSDGLLDWIGEIVKWLIEGIGIVGVGIIVFTLILKTIVLPLDIYSRIKTKKQALIMEQMRPQMEKLQKQYANDEKMYNQKVMELQKKNGYSMLGACLPMLVSLVIFFVVFGAFSSYTRYANIESYNGMVKAYNDVVITYVIDEDEVNAEIGSKDGFLIPYDADKNPIVLTAETKAEDIVDYKVDFTRFAAKYDASLTEDGAFIQLMEQYKQAHPELSLSGNAENISEEIRLTLVSFYMEGSAAEAAAQYYAENDNGFLWVKNIWYPDSTLNTEIPSFDKFQSTVQADRVDSSYEESYNKVTAQLGEQKSTYNGYYILVVLSIGFMLLQQFISMRSNKSVNDLSTVNGTGAKTNKWMMLLMPVIYGVFAFSYSAAFSIYMITNTIYSIITTLIINWAVNAWFNRKKAEVGANKAKIRK